MADIRINALATTAASTASDDFIAVDGSANGTRKLNAYSPTFGGNLTVSGVTTSAGISNSGALTFTAAAGQVAGSIAKNATYGLTYFGVTGSSNDNTMLNASGAVVLSNPAGTTNATLAGNLTVSGTGTSNVGGTLVVGSTSAASGSGKLELATHTSAAGGIGFGTDTSLYRTGTGSLAIDGGTLPILRFFNGATQYGYVYAGSTDGELACVTGPLRLKSNNTTALTLDNSQNATFAGTIKPQLAATASAPTYVKGAIYFDTTLNKLRVGGATGWETITSV